MPTDVGRFHVVSTLGEGGMGIVYAAEDTSLGRRVAIKMLRGTSTDPAARERLVREARAAARVSHPAVCQVYEVGVHEGEPYVAMELLEGEPLSARIARGPIPLREAVDLALGILEGLSALHRQGIVHRDLKPSNVFLTPTGVKLLDLGLALPLQEDLTQTDVRLTRTGMLVGTPGFMAPEQWTHEGVGPSADLFALGALLHEMLSGKPAFVGANLLDIYHSILHEPAPVLTGGPGVDAVDRVIRHALEKRPEDRPPTAAAMSDDLRAARKAVPEGDGAASAGDVAPPRARRQTRIAVLPFRVARPDPDTDFLGPGLADSLTAALAALEGVVVRSPQVSARAAGPDVDLEALARIAQVDLVLQGTVMKAGDRVRVQIQLVEAPGGTVVKADSIVTPVGDVFALEDELTRRIVECLALPLSGRGGKSARPAGPAGQEAYELYLRANAAALHHGRLTDARDLFHAALEHDPTFAPAWARLGRVHRVRAKYSQGVVAEDEIRLAEEAFRKALALDPDLATAHHLFTHFEIEESGRADLALVRLLERGRAHPAEAELYVGLVVACRFGGLFRASVAADRAARRLEPGVRTSVAYTWWMLGEWEKSIAADDEDARWLHQYSLPLLGRGAEALALIEEGVSRAPPGVGRMLFELNRGSIRGDRRAVDAGMTPILASGFHDPEGLYFGVRCLSHVGDSDGALRLLERVVAGGLFIPSVLRSDPWLAAAREHPAFADLLARSEAGHRRAVALYREAGGERLLGVDAS